jgi:hypothetical protein
VRASRDVEEREGEVGLEDLVGQLGGVEGILEGRRRPSATSVRPFRIASAASSSSFWDEVPLIPELRRRPGRRPRRSARRAVGSSYCQLRL